MPSRKYYLVGDGTAINMRQKMAREKMIRSVSITSSGENVGSSKSHYICEVRKSPRAPEYVVHYVKTKADGIQLVKHKPRPVRRLPDKDTNSNLTVPSEDEEKLESETTDQEKDDMVGLRVIACNKQDGLYYPGHVSHTPESAYAIVSFNYHKRQKVRTQMIIPMSGAIPRPELAPGDFVLVRVFNQSTEAECFVPGIVEVTPEDFRHHAKFYSVLLYNGQRETTMRKCIVKIGKARFEMAIRFIAHIQQQKILRQENALSGSSGLPSPQSSKRSDDDVSSTRSSQSGRGRRKKEKITKKIVKRKEEVKNVKSRRKSRSRSRSKSSRSSRSKSSRSSRSKSSSQSRSSASSRSRSRSQSSRSQSERSQSRSASSRSRSRSRSPSSRSQSERSQSGSDSSRSRSRSSERSRTKSSKRKANQSSRHTRSQSRSDSSESRSRSSERPKTRSSRRGANKSSRYTRSQSRSRSSERPKTRSSRRGANQSSRYTRSQSRSRSRSSERPKTKSSRRRSVSSSRSRSSSSSSSTIRSRSSVQRSRPKSAAPQRSRSSSKSSRSRSRSKSQGSRGSSTPRAQSPYDRPHRPTPSARPRTPPIRTESMLESPDITRKDIYTEKSQLSKTSKYVNVDEKDEMIQDLQYQLEKQQRKQLRQERRLVRQARKINKIQRKLRDSDSSHNESGQSSHTDRSDRNKTHRSSSSETDTSPQRRKGSPDGTSHRDSPDVQILRRSSPGLQTNLEVLARWQDDGWFYRGCVVAEGKDQKYIVRDSTGYMETITRDDILTDNEHRFDAIQPEDKVIGLHPKYVFSYAPAEVLGTYSNRSIKVEFFDGNIAELTSEEVYKIPKEKYEQVLEYIKRCEKHLIGHSVVARDDSTGLYKLGIVDSRVGLGQQYYIKWLDGDMSKQNGNHIFEVARRQTRHEDWSHVLAPVSQHSMIFMPAEVIQSRPLIVQFCDGKRSSEATLDQCFWLSKEYYSNARGYLMNIKYRKLTDDVHSVRSTTVMPGDT